MQEESYDHDADDEWTIEDIFVLRSLAMFIVVCAILILYEIYLDQLLEMWRAGHLDFLVFYGARDFRPTLYTITNVIIIISCFVLFVLAWREKHG